MHLLKIFSMFNLISSNFDNKIKLPFNNPLSFINFNNNEYSELMPQRANEIPQPEFLNNFSYFPVSGGNNIYDELKTYFIKTKSNIKLETEKKYKRFNSAHYSSSSITSNQVFENINFLSPCKSKEKLNNELITNPFVLNFDQFNQTKYTSDTKNTSSQFPEGESMKVEYDDCNNIN